MATLASRYLRIGRCNLLSKTPRRVSKHPQSIGRRFSVSSPQRANTLMETSGFSDTQLQVREAVGKICSNFPDASHSPRIHTFKSITGNRNTGPNMMNSASILMSFMRPLLRMDGLALLCKKNLVEPDWASRKLR